MIAGGWYRPALQVRVEAAIAKLGFAFAGCLRPLLSRTRVGFTLLSGSTLVESWVRDSPSIWYASRKSQVTEVGRCQVRRAARLRPLLSLLVEHEVCTPGPSNLHAAPGTTGAGRAAVAAPELVGAGRYTVQGACADAGRGMRSASSCCHSSDCGLKCILQRQE